mmetsp:Transcript_75434/g.125769  ORF Transcript_75434/g.125769 Transcript_75434/m.125769 type:complete len:400 (-) Transcript_75434:425-1624(-)
MTEMTAYNCQFDPRLDEAELHLPDEATYTLASPGMLQTQAKDACDNGDLCDVTIVTEGQRFHCHRLILAFGSRMLKTMFASQVGNPDKEEVCLDANTVDARSFEYILSWLYTNTVEIDSAALMPLLFAADHLQIDSLCEHCLQLLESQLTPENAVDIWQIAELGFPPGIAQSHIDRLQQAALHCCLNNFVAVFSVVDNLRKLSAAHFERLLTSEMLRSPEEIVFSVLMRWRAERRAAGSPPELEFAKLLRLVRFPLMRPSFLATSVHQASLDSTLTAGASTLLKDCLIEAYRYSIIGITDCVHHSIRHRPRGNEVQTSKPHSDPLGIAMMVAPTPTVLLPVMPEPVVPWYQHNGFTGWHCNSVWQQQTITNTTTYNNYNRNADAALAYYNPDTLDVTWR